jgi:hypothetical protein
MSLGSWFRHRVSYTRTVISPTEKGAAEAAGASAEKEEVATGNVSSLVSADSLATFAGGSIGITVVWGGIERIFSLPHYLWLGAIISAVFGLCILLSDLTDPARAPRPAVFMRILAAVVNTFILFNAASGGLTSIGAAGTGSNAQTASASMQFR